MLIKVIQEMGMEFRKKHIWMLILMFVSGFILFGPSRLEEYCYMSWANASCFWLFFGMLFEENMNVFGVPKVFFYVPRVNGGIQRYIRMRIFAETFLYFTVSIIMLAFLCILSVLDGTHFYVGHLEWQIPSMILFFALLLRWRTAGLCRLFTGKGVPAGSNIIKIVHYIMVVINFLLIQSYGGQMEYSLGGVITVGSTLNLPYIWIMVVSILSLCHVGWYTHYCIKHMIGAEVSDLPSR